MSVCLYKLQITSCNLQVAIDSYKLQTVLAESYGGHPFDCHRAHLHQLRVTSARVDVCVIGIVLNFTSYELQATGYKLRVTSYKLQVTSYKSRVPGWISV